MQISARYGSLIITCDPDPLQSKGGIWYPDGLRGKPKTGLVLLHTNTSWWEATGEENLQGKRVVFDRWGSRMFKVVDKTEHWREFYSVREGAVLAVLDERWCDFCGQRMHDHGGSNAIFDDNPNCQRMEVLE